MTMGHQKDNTMSRREFSTLLAASGLAGSLSLGLPTRATAQTAGMQWPTHVEDFPVLAGAGDGKIWMASLERPDGVRLIRVSRIENNKAVEYCRLELPNITGIGKPAIAPLGHGCVVAFPVENRTGWQIAWAIVDGSAPPVIQRQNSGATNIAPAVVVTGSRVWIVWESNAGESRGIYAGWINNDRLSDVRRISAPDATSCNPALVALPNGDLFAAWDSIRNRQADIYGAWYRNGAWETEQRISADPRIERHVNLAVRNNEIWLAWQAQSYPNIQLNQILEQRVVVAKLTPSGLEMPTGLFTEVATDTSKMMRPQIAFDADGRLWLSVRQATENTHSGWHPVAWCYTGSEWSKPVLLAGREGRWRPVAMVCNTDNALTASQYDAMPKGFGDYRGKIRNWRSELAIRPLPVNDMPAAAEIKTESLRMPPTDFSLTERIEQVSADLPRQRVQHAGRELALYFGDLHDHTDMSVCNRQGNPPGPDLFANVRDIEQLDFSALTDHGYNLDLPQWAYNGEITRSYHDPEKFLTFLAQEWTSSSSRTAGGYGHRNLIFLDPFYPKFYDSFENGMTPTALWDMLGDTDFVCIPHQIADWKNKGRGNPPTDWNYVSERFQPVAEIFQTRGSYEHLGAPRQAGDATPFKGHYLQDAWARGIIIGVIASPDHGGGRGKVGVWAEGKTRESIFGAIQARHTFGTSGAKMGLHVRCGDAMMGDKVKASNGSRRFQMKAAALRDIEELVVIRNNEIVFAATPGTTEYEIEWVDSQPPKNRLTWYYVRIHAADDELAWSSPIWFVA
jgi:hypothetical protein